MPVLMGNDIEFKVLSQFENVQVISQGQRILVLLWNDFHPIVYSQRCLVAEQKSFICKTSGCCHVRTCNNYINWNHDILHFSDFLLTYFNYFDNYIKKVNNISAGDGILVQFPGYWSRVLG